MRIVLFNIRYATSADDYQLLYLTDGTQLLTSENLSDRLARLPQSQFCRIHRSHFVR